MKRHATAAAMVVGLALLVAPAADATTELRQQCPADTTIETLGCYDPGTDTIYYNGDQRVLWHERGHAFDYQKLTDEDRDWLAARYFPDLPWRYAGDRFKDDAGELFAEYYAACRMRAPRNPTGGRTLVAVGYNLMAYTAKHRRFCNTVAILELVR